jgi:hypothetical protein
MELKHSTGVKPPEDGENVPKQISGTGAEHRTNKSTHGFLLQSFRQPSFAFGIISIGLEYGYG